MLREVSEIDGEWTSFQIIHKRMNDNELDTLSTQRFGSESKHKVHWNDLPCILYTQMQCNCKHYWAIECVAVRQLAWTTANRRQITTSMLIIFAHFYRVEQTGIYWISRGAFRLFVANAYSRSRNRKINRRIDNCTVHCFIKHHLKLTE